MGRRRLGWVLVVLAVLAAACDSSSPDDVSVSTTSTPPPSDLAASGDGVAEALSAVVPAEMVGCVHRELKGLRNDAEILRDLDPQTPEMAQALAAASSSCDLVRDPAADAESLDLLRRDPHGLSAPAAECALEFLAQERSSAGILAALRGQPSGGFTITLANAKFACGEPERFSYAPDPEDDD